MVELPPISSQASWNIVACLQLKNNAPGSASAADATTKHNIAHKVINDPFNLIGSVGLGFHLEEVPTCSTVCICLRWIRYVRVDVQNHIQRMELHCCVRVIGQIIKELFVFALCSWCRVLVCLLLCWEPSSLSGWWLTHNTRCFLLLVGYVLWHGARLRGSKSNAVNLILRLFLYHFVHTMSSWHHESIHNNTNNQQTPPPWWWSRLPLQRHGFNKSTPSKWWAALCIYFPRLLLKGFGRINKLM